MPNRNLLLLFLVLNWDAVTARLADLIPSAVALDVADAIVRDLEDPIAGEIEPVRIFAAARRGQAFQGRGFAVLRLA
jgi:hypothetical protein